MENTTADILAEDQLWPHMVTVDQERELHKPNSLTKCEAFIVGRIVNISCVLAKLNMFTSFGWGGGGFTGSGNGVFVDVYWNTSSLLVLKL